VDGRLYIDIARSILSSSENVVYHNQYVIIVIGRSSTTFSAQLTACLRDLARHFKTDPTETERSVLGIHRVFEPIVTVSTG
jgi:hypothetical protein